MDCDLILIKARPLTFFLKEKISEDPLYLLDQKSRSWIEPYFEKVGRRFLQDDFEKRLKHEFLLSIALFSCQIEKVRIETC